MGGSKKITFQSLLSSLSLRACFATHPVLALSSVRQWNGKMSPVLKASYMIRFQPSLQIGVIFVFAFFCRTEARRSANLFSTPHARLSLCARLAFASIRLNESDENTKPYTA